MTGIPSVVVVLVLILSVIQCFYIDPADFFNGAQQRPKLEIVHPDNGQVLSSGDLKIKIKIDGYDMPSKFHGSNLCVGLSTGIDFTEQCFDQSSDFDFHVNGLSAGTQYALRIVLYERGNAIAVSVRNFKVAGIRTPSRVGGAAEQPSGHATEVVTIQTAVQVALQLQLKGLEAQAEDIYRSILSEDPAQPDALHLLGVIVYQKGDPRAAVQYIEKALESNHTSEVYHNSLGVCYRTLGRIDEAEKQFLNALDLNPNYLSSKFNLGLVSQQRDDWEAAITLYREVIAGAIADPTNEIGANAFMESKVRECDLLQALKRFTEAVICWEEGTVMFPRNDVMWNEMGSSLLQIGEYEAAYDRYRKAIELGSSTAELNAANLLELLGYDRESSTKFSEAIVSAARRNMPTYHIKIRRALVQPRILPSSESELNLLRDRIDRELTYLATASDAHIEIDNTPPIAFGFSTGYHLAFHNRNNVAIKQKLFRVYATLCPALLQGYFLGRFQHMDVDGKVVYSDKPFFDQSKDEDGAAGAENVDRVVALVTESLQRRQQQAALAEIEDEDQDEEEEEQGAVVLVGVDDVDDVDAGSAGSAASAGSSVGEVVTEVEVSSAVTDAMTVAKARSSLLVASLAVEVGGTDGHFSGGGESTSAAMTAGALRTPLLAPVGADMAGMGAAGVSTAGENRGPAVALKDSKDDRAAISRVENSSDISGTPLQGLIPVKASAPAVPSPASPRRHKTKTAKKRVRVGFVSRYLRGHPVGVLCHGAMSALTKSGKFEVITFLIDGDTAEEELRLAQEKHAQAQAQAQARANGQDISIPLDAAPDEFSWDLTPADESFASRPKFVRGMGELPSSSDASAAETGTSDSAGKSRWHRSSSSSSSSSSSIRAFSSQQQGQTPDDPVFRGVLAASSFVYGLPPSDISVAAKVIRAAEIDVLIFPELGIDPITYFLAFARLAPVQATWLGHADTSGIRSIDYFLTSSSEVPNADTYYSEKLYRLGGFGTYFSDFSGKYAGIVREDANSPRSTILHRAKFTELVGIPKSAHIYVIAHSLSELHPDFDHAIINILAQDKLGYLLLIDEVSPRASWRRLFLNRLSQELGNGSSRMSNELVDRVITYSPATSTDAVNVMRIGHLMLDPFPVSGGYHPTLEALAIGLPVVTFPSHRIAGRLTLALFRMLGYPHDHNSSDRRSGSDSDSGSGSGSGSKKGTNGAPGSRSVLGRNGPAGLGGGGRGSGSGVEGDTAATRGSSAAEEAFEILVVESAGEYVSTAVKIAHQPKLRAALSAAILAYKHRLFPSDSAIQRAFSKGDRSAARNPVETETGTVDAGPRGSSSAGQRVNEESARLVRSVSRDWERFINSALANATATAASAASASASV